MRDDISAKRRFLILKRLISSGLAVGFKEGNVIRYYGRDISRLIECIRRYTPDTWINLASKFADMYSNVTKKILSEKQNNNNINSSSIIVNVCKR